MLHFLEVLHCQIIHCQVFPIGFPYNFKTYKGKMLDTKRGM